MLCLWHCAKSFTTCNPSKNSELMLPSLIYDGRNWSWERLVNQPKVTQLIKRKWNLHCSWVASCSTPQMPPAPFHLIISNTYLLSNQLFLMWLLNSVQSRFRPCLSLCAPPNHTQLAVSHRSPALLLHSDALKNLILGCAVSSLEGWELSLGALCMAWASSHPNSRCLQTIAGFSN